MPLVEIPWVSRVWALPFLSVLAPSERYAAKRGTRHKKITEWAWQLLLQVRRWYPKREIVAVADRAYASLKLLDQCRKLSNPNRRMSKDYERLAQSSEAFIYVAMSRLMARRLARS
jgi:hypothetical protein